MGRHTFTFQTASNKFHCNATPAIVVVTWHLCSVLWAFSASTLNSTENLKMYLRTSVFPRTRKIKDLWKMPSWKRESRIMQLNTNPLANPAVNSLQLGPIPNKGSLLVQNPDPGVKPSAGEFQFSVPQRRWYFLKMAGLKHSGIQQCAVAAISAPRKPFFCQIPFAASVLKPAVGLTMHEWCRWAWGLSLLRGFL